MSKPAPVWIDRLDRRLRSFAHGINIHYGEITPPNDVDVVMVAPRMPAKVSRQLTGPSGKSPAIQISVDACGSGH